ncbi:SGNH hydrolase-type esterase domain-containing protein [Mycotypha africana]|uniref:SGNH hydrolase-type esterase domain-containing protein n=1 Tax=Mycotypha africana TaxID=64632 RepID=UPI0022FFCFE9|nr:SGNH hydrolase-type esterase domain-containing protein [Mycotypha africana]KAI8967874.1 SGNH hydrolase-type esterase domain-containing protein [Mycotypha africana]
MAKESNYYEYVYTNVNSNQILQRNPDTDVAYIQIGNEIKEFATGGPYTVGAAIDVYVGDVWVMAGQSNMRGHGWLQDPYTLEDLTVPAEKGISLFNSSEVWTIASDPSHQLYLSPRSVHHTLPDPTVREPGILKYRGASLGLAFAKEYILWSKEHRDNKSVPVGLVACAHGGTTLADWKRPNVLDRDTADTSLYGAMLHKIRKVGRIAGVLWYQGESDATTFEAAKTYAATFTRWQKDLQMDVQNDSLPIVFVQIGPHRLDSAEMKENWCIVQQQQYSLFSARKHTAGVTSIDCALDDRLHLSAKGLTKIGKRMAEASMHAKEGNGPLLAFQLMSYQYALSSDRVLCDKVAPALYLYYNIEETNLKKAWLKNTVEEVYGFSIESEEKGVQILTATMNHKTTSIRLVLTKKPEKPIYVSYGINGVGVNVTLGRFTLPAFYRLKIMPLDTNNPTELTPVLDSNFVLNIENEHNITVRH